MLDPQTLQQRREHFAHINQRLTEGYGYPAWRQHLPPVDELVSTILSQATSDINRDKGFDALKARYPDWEAVMDATVEEITATIRSAGLAHQKAPRIKESLQYLSEKTGKISLDFLNDMPVPAAKSWLTSMAGIGPKTAAIILCFAFNKPAFPVDTHVHRVTQRLGLIDLKTSADKAHDEMEAIVPPQDYYAAHLNIIRHGREVCKARNPLCQKCFLTEHCHFYQTEQGALKP
jgi:endonuclease III